MIPKSKIPLISIAFATTLTLSKLFVALYSGSLAVLSSALDSLLDILSSMVNYFALKTAEAPPDKNHPFGHGKFEALAAFIQSFIIFVTGLFLLWKSVDNFISGKHLKDVDASVYIMVFSVFMTVILSVILRYYAKKHNSNVILTDAMHYEIDLITNSGVLLSLFVVKFFNFHSIDYIVSFAISLYIMVSSFKLGYNVSKELLDSEIKASELEVIKDVLKKHDELIIDYHRIRTRKAGKTIFVDMHITICRESTLESAHRIAMGIEKELKESIPDIDVIIHIDPCDEKNCTGRVNCSKLNRL